MSKKYKKILLIDDDEDDQEIFLSAIGEIDISIKCESISDAKSALEKLQSGELNPDVIFLDLNMPIMNGQQFLVEIKKREQLKKIPVIIFTTSSHAGTIQLTKELGAEDFITKPGKYSELIQLLKSFLEGITTQKVKQV